jgi:TonB family protein
MKAVRKLAVLISLGLSSGFAFAAKTPEQSYIETCRKGPGMPEPTVVVTPRVEAAYEGASVEVTFVVDATGRPTALAVASAPDATLAAAVVEAVSKWRFKPVLRNGVPVATKVALPVRIGAGPLAGARYAAD